MTAKPQENDMRDYVADFLGELAKMNPSHKILAETSLATMAPYVLLCAFEAWVRKELKKETT